MLQHVIIRNCGNGAVAAAIRVAPDLVNDLPWQLTLDKTTIENSIGYGLLSFGGSVKAENCLIHSCGATALALLQGGNYELNNCTIATYGNNKISHNDNPVAAIFNFFYTDETHYRVSALACTMRNCVIAGSLENEFIADSLKDAPAAITLQNCLLKMTDVTKIPAWVQRSNVRYTKADGTLDPQFTDVAKWNYRPKSATSPLIDSGTSYPNMPATDLDDNPRTARSAADIGCYELQ